jgi:hypothetical protein
VSFIGGDSPVRVIGLQCYRCQVWLG